MSDKNFHGKNITNFINKSEATVTILRKDSRGNFRFHKNVEPEETEGGLDDISLGDLRFVVDEIPKDKNGFYFSIVPGEHTEGPENHIDGETGHPEGFGGGE